MEISLGRERPENPVRRRERLIVGGGSADG